MQTWIVHPLFFLLLFFLALPFLPLKLGIRIYREPNNLQIFYRVMLWFIPLQGVVRNPLSKGVWELSENRFWKKKAPADLRGKRVNWARMILRMRHIREIFSPCIFRANRVFWKLKQPIVIKELKVYSEFGLQDAAATAVCSGLLWAVLGAFYSQLARFFKVHDRGAHFYLTPNYHKGNYFALDTSCIFEMRLGHIIIILYQFLLKGREILSLLRRVSQ